MNASSDQSSASGNFDKPEFPEFDPLTPDHIRDPWPLLARARKEQPVFWMPKLQMYCITKHSDVRIIHSDAETFTNGGANLMRVPLPEGIDIPEGCPFPSVGESLANADGAAHLRLRKLMQGAFSRSRVAQFSSQIEEIAHELIDAFADRGSADLVEEFSNKIAMQTIAAVLGFKKSDTDSFRAWTDQFLNLMGSPEMGEDEARELWTGLIDWWTQIDALVKSRRKEPGDDLISDLIAANPGDGIEPLSDAEIAANVIAFIVAGTDTTAILITQTVRRLHIEGMWDAVVQDRAQLDNVMEESLRFCGVVRGLNRVVAKDTELSGVKIPKGSVLYWMGSAANRDKEVFDEPEKFNPARPSLHEHVAFSGGRHFCIGAPLARLESKIAFNALFDRLPHLTVPDQEFELYPNFITPTPKRLLVEWDVTKS
ncbi:cytochrome P450 [Hyphococcus sp.]|uniref:cytochrome P450 n=1 Tax=Hyphococcus sp. TaxID=2038636 RepID=UPI003CCBED51